MGTEQKQEQLQMRMKMLDDVFHRSIIALERLELYLESENPESQCLQLTGIKTDRDLHDDYQNPPTKESYYGEMQLQCTSLFFQTEFDDQELFEKTAKYFLKDLFEWYGGRTEHIVPNDVERFFIPLAVVINRQIASVIDVSKAVSEYVCDIQSIDDMNTEEKAASVKAGFEAWLKAEHLVSTEMQDFKEKGVEVVLSSHKRGTVSQGISRLLNSFQYLYEEKSPSLLLLKIVTYYFPEILEEIDGLTEEQITEFFTNKKNKEDEHIEE